MNWNIIALANCPASPWKNGGGTTRELIAWPSPGDWRWRISVADIDRDGPFSQFEDVHRWFAVLSGAGVNLHINGRAHALTAQSDPIGFDGRANTSCTLPAGPTQDINLMTRDALKTNMRRFRGQRNAKFAASTVVAIYAINDAVITPEEGDVVTISAATMAWCLLDTTTSYAVTSANAICMEIIE